jgi:protein associated with RNAse G/E
MDVTDVRVVWRKYDESLHWHQTMTLLGEDEHGTWVGAPAGMISRKGEDGPPVATKQPHVMLIPREGWWTAAFYGPPTHLDIYIDISTPPRWPDAGEVTMVDLDLDVVRRQADQYVTIVDQDEFAEHQLRYGYPPEVIATAEETADRLYAAVLARADPFAGNHLRWLDLVTDHTSQAGA